MSVRWPALTSVERLINASRTKGLGSNVEWSLRFVVYVCRSLCCCFLIKRPRKDGDGAGGGVPSFHHIGLLRSESEMDFMRIIRRNEREPEGGRRGETVPSISFDKSPRGRSNILLLFLSR